MEKTSTVGRIERVAKKWTPDSYLLVPHQNGEVRFVYPSFQNNYVNAGSSIINSGLEIPTGSESVSLLNEAYHSEDKEFNNSPETDFIRNDVMKQRWLWVFNRNIWTPKNAKNAGVYVQFDSQAKGMSEILSVNDLEDALSGGKTENGVRFSKDGRTAFASYNTTRAGSHDKGTLAKNGFVIASYGLEGAEKLDNVSREFTFKPYVYLVDNTQDKPVQSLSALGRSWDDDYGLSVDGGADGLGRSGYAFGVCDSAEGSAPKK